MIQLREMSADALLHLVCKVSLNFGHICNGARRYSALPASNTIVNTTRVPLNGKPQHSLAI